MDQPDLLSERRGAAAGFAAAIVMVGAIRFALSLSGVPDKIATYSSMTLVITVGWIYFAIVCPKWKDRLIAAYVLFVPYTLVEIVTLGYTSSMPPCRIIWRTQADLSQPNIDGRLCLSIKRGRLIVSSCSDY
jgi:hypothetical protein